MFGLNIGVFGQFLDNNISADQSAGKFSLKQWLQKSHRDRGGWDNWSFHEDMVVKGMIG